MSNKPIEDNRVLIIRLNTTQLKSVQNAIEQALEIMEKTEKNETDESDLVIEIFNQGNEFNHPTHCDLTLQWHNEDTMGEVDDYYVGDDIMVYWEDLD